jgi:hypothetical protein
VQGAAPVGFTGAGFDLQKSGGCFTAEVLSYESYGKKE